MDHDRSQSANTPRRTDNRKSRRDLPCRADEAMARMRFACGAARRHATIVKPLAYC